MVNPTSLIAAGARKLTKLVLFPVRFLHTLRTGQIGENEAAVHHYLTFAIREIEISVCRFSLAYGAPSDY
jgi:hypothetical protein